MLEYIELTNWKTHGSSTLKFQKGVNVLIGLMGAGKSSVMDAISFALFGTFPALKHKRVKTSDIIRNVPDEHDYAAVTLGFDSEGDRYVVSRRIPKSGTASARLEKNGKPFQTQPTKVTEEIEGILKIDYDTFSRAIYSEQNNMSYFLDLMKGDRKKQIDGMLGLDHFATAEEHTTSVLNNIRALISGEEQGLAQSDSAAIKGQLASLVKEKTELLEVQRKLRAEADMARKEVASAEDRLSRVREDYSKKKRLEEEIAGLSSRTKTLEAEIEKIRKLGIDAKAVEIGLGKAYEEQRIAEEEAKRLNSESRNLERELAAAREESNSAERSIKLRDEAADKLKVLLSGRTIEALRKGIESSTNSINDMNAKLASLRNAKAEAEKWAAELKKHFSTCPLCGNTLSPEMKEKLISEKESAVAESKDEISKVSADIKAMEAERERLRKEENDASALETKLKEYDGIDEKAKKARSEANRLAKDRETLSAKLDEANKRLRDVAERAMELKAKKESATRRSEYEAEVSDAQQKIANARKSIATLVASDELLAEAQEKLRELSARNAELGAKADGNEKYLSGIESQIADKTAQLNEISRARERIEKRRELLGELNKFKNALVETEAELRSMLVGSINEMMYGLWPELYPYGDYDGVRLDAMKDDYVLEARRSGNSNSEWIPIDTVASGGERSIASLALRIAMSMVIVPNLRILMLDEPTHNIDSAGMDKMISVLTETLPNIVEQIFVITHDEALKQIGLAKVYLFDRDKKANGSTIVSEI